MRGELRKREGSIQWLTASFSTQCRLLCGTNTTLYFLLAVLREEDLEKNYLFHFLAVHTHTHTTHAWTNTTDTRTHVQKKIKKNSHTHARTRAPNRLNDFLHQLYPRLNKEVELRCLRVLLWEVVRGQTDHLVHALLLQERHFGNEPDWTDQRLIPNNDLRACTYRSKQLNDYNCLLLHGLTKLCLCEN